MSPDEHTFSLRYLGPRFDGARLPLDVLADLQAFRELLLAFAKDYWRANHRDRERLPKGFDRSISLDLVALRDGSAIPLLAWRRSEAQQMLPDFTDQIDDAVRDGYAKIVTLFHDAENNIFPQQLPPQQIRALNKLGVNLRDGEQIEFHASEQFDERVVSLDTWRRKAILTKLTEMYEARYEGIGILVTNDINGWVRIRTADKGELPLPVHPDRITLDFDGNLGATVQFAVQMQFDRSDNVKQITEVISIELVDPDMADGLRACHKRLEVLRLLPQNWHQNNEGEPIAAKAYDTCRAFLGRRASRSKEYRLFPTIDGGILIEFIANGWDLSVEFHPNGELEFLGVEVEGDSDFGPDLFNGVTEDFLHKFDARTEQA